jgi:anion-transporting  ArsA/GET3 family ATPase
LAQARIAIFCGKGGVGKTTLAAAFGLEQAQAGRKVLLVTSHPMEEFRLALRLDGVETRYPLSASNLRVAHIDPKEILAERVRTAFSVELLAEQVLGSSLYQSLVEVAPGLKEFSFLARLQEMASGVRGGEIDLLVWDAPATGHFLSTLRSARNFQSHLTGPMASAGADAAAFFSSPEHIRLLPVAALEEMAVQEMVELCEAVRSSYGIRPSLLLLNMASPLVDAPMCDVEDVEAAAVASPALRFALGRAVGERDRAKRARRDTGARSLTVPRFRESTDLDLVARVGPLLAAEIDA